jgi:hypothetical protein
MCKKKRRGGKYLPARSTRLILLAVSNDMLVVGSTFVLVKAMVKMACELLFGERLRFEFEELSVAFTEKRWHSCLSKRPFWLWNLQPSRYRFLENFARQFFLKKKKEKRVCSDTLFTAIWSVPPLFFFLFFQSDYLERSST